MKILPFLKQLYCKLERELDPHLNQQIQSGMIRMHALFETNANKWEEVIKTKITTQMDFPLGYLSEHSAVGYIPSQVELSPQALELLDSVKKQKEHLHELEERMDSFQRKMFLATSTEISLTTYLGLYALGHLKIEEVRIVMLVNYLFYTLEKHGGAGFRPPRPRFSPNTLPHEIEKDPVIRELKAYFRKVKQ